MPPFSTLVGADTLVTRISDPQWAVFDCRFDLGNTEAGWEQYRRAHIPGAVYAHLDDHLSGPITPLTGRHPLPNVTNLLRWLGQCGVNQETQVVVYDDTGGNMAVRLWWLLRWLGHQAVAVLDGGWPYWQALGLPATDAVTTTTPAQFAGEPDWSQVLSTEDVLKNLDTLHWCLIDARTEIRFRGEQEPIDPVAGHIPGSVNLPLQLNLTEQGRFKSSQQLHNLYTKALQGHDPKMSACLCGSGVTACHNILAMEIAGLSGCGLYAGSWSEWIRDPSRPIATNTQQS